MNYAALKAELADPSYQEMDDKSAANAINTKTETLPIAISAREIRAILFARGKWLAVTKKGTAARVGTDTSDEAALCQLLYDLAADSASVDMSDAPTAQAATGALQVLVGKGVIAQDDMDALIGAATIKSMWAIKHLNSEATDYDVKQARANQ